MRLGLAAAVLVAWAVAAGAAGAHPAAPEAAIRAERARLNAAIAAHDFNSMKRSFLTDYTIFPGSSGAPFDVDAFARRLAPTFADPGFVTYIRTPERIFVSAQGKRAAETGHWLGLWHKADGTMRLSGIYQATWMPTADGWRLKNESYVSLRCTGSRACAEVF